MKKILIFLFFITAFLILLPQAKAQPIDPTVNPFGHIDRSGQIITDPAINITQTTIPDKIVQLVNWFAWFITLASVVMGLYAGFLFITSRGDPAQLKTARQTLFWAIIGIAVAILAFSIIEITITIFT